MTPPDTAPDGRAAAAQSIADAARVFPRLGARGPHTTDLPAREARLAAAIHRLTIQRWITLEYLLNRHLRKPLDRLEPAMQGVLLTAAAQILFMTRMPTPAVVDSCVSLARRMVRPGAAGLANAVLRRIGDLVLHAADTPGARWTPAADRLPLETGFLTLRESILPEPDNRVHHLAIATSCPRTLVQTFLRDHGTEQAAAMCLAGLRHPPTIVGVERGFDPAGVNVGDQPLRPHVQRGYVLWPQGQSGLPDFLAGHPARRVQDPGSAAAVEAAHLPDHFKPRLIVDWCAGRGTKTGQLARLHTDAQIIATDVDPACRHMLAETFASHRRVSVVEPDVLLRGDRLGAVDLLLLDVPCSNTGVLARRPEARYRFSRATLNSLRDVQQRIVTEAMPLLAPHGCLLYVTCSICEEENRGRVDWMMERFGLKLVAEHLRLPEGDDASYRDGGYDALLMPA